MFIDTKEDIIEIANELWQLHWNMQPIRLLGHPVQDIEEKKQLGKQLDLFTYKKEAEREKLYHTIDTLSEEYGKNPFKSLEMENDQEDEQPRTSFQKDNVDE